LRTGSFVTVSLRCTFETLGAAAAGAAVLSTARSALNAVLASGSTVPQVFSNASTSLRTSTRRVAASTLLSSIATMLLRKLWQVVSGEKFAR
jgi:hypothetical protein